MEKRIVAIVRFEKPLESVRRAVDLSHGLDHLPNKANVFIKPNIVFWTRTTPFPKVGSRYNIPGRGGYGDPSQGAWH